MYSVGLVLQYLCHIFFDPRQTADTGTYTDTYTVRIFLFHIKLCIRKSLLCRSHRILRKLIHSAGRFEIHTILSDKAFHFCCHFHFILCCIKFRDRSNTDTAGTDALPEFRHGVSDGSYRSQSCYYHTSFHRSLLYMHMPPSTWITCPVI